MLVLLVLACLPLGAEAASGLSSRPLPNACVAPERPASNGDNDDNDGNGDNGDNRTIELQTVALEGISWPTEMVQAPGDPTKWYVVDRDGTVSIYQAGQTFTRIGTFIDISSRVQRVLSGREWNEMGLLSMAFHPDFQSNGQFFLYFTADGTGDTPLEARLSRFTSTNGGVSANAATEQVVLRVPRNGQYHWGGRPAFGSDGYLYMSVGDGGPHQNAQNLNNINGKFLRIDVDDGTPYAIPPDNPFAGGGGLPEIWAYGFRNPWRWSFDALTGEIWEGDVGPGDREEVNKIVKGGNYGWSLFQGTLCHFSTTCDYTGLVEPVLEYSHDAREEISGDAVIGGYVYRGSLMPGFYGTYIFGDANGKVFGFDTSSNGPTELLADTGIFILSISQSPFDFELYVLSRDAIYRVIQSPGTLPSSNFPLTLSESACVQPGNARQPASGLIPYDVNVELWSDDATKRRWMGLPDNARIHVNSEGDFEFPVGTLLIKDFSLAGKRVETRWMVRHDDGQWAGYSFEWNDRETDATLVPAEGKQKQVGSQTWTYPSRSQCLSCHTTAAGRSLGPEVAQLNGDLLYPQTGMTGNQLETLEFIGLFDAPLPDVPANLDRLPHLNDTSASLRDRSRAYLHANCSICHRPDGTGQGPADFRYWLLTSQVGVINETPTQGDLGLSDPKLIAPGLPGQSVMLQRMLTLDSTNRMPPLASALVDVAGTQLITDWIAAMPELDVVTVDAANYDAGAQNLQVIASTSLDDAVVLTAFAKNNDVLAELGPLTWNVINGDHRATIPNVTVQPDCLAVSSTGGGYDEVPVAGTCSAGGGGGGGGAVPPPEPDTPEPSSGGGAPGWPILLLLLAAGCRRLLELRGTNRIAVSRSG